MILYKDAQITLDVQPDLRAPLEALILRMNFSYDGLGPRINRANELYSYVVKSTDIQRGLLCFTLLKVIKRFNCPGTCAMPAVFNGPFYK